METTGGAPTQAVPASVQASEAEVMPQNMTGEEAVKWVEAQKAKKEGPKKDPYLADNDKKVNYRGPQDGSSEPQDGSSAVKEAAAEAKRRLKIDDEEVDEDEVIKIFKERRKHQQHASRILEEGRRARQQAEEFVSMLRDPEKAFEVLKKLGHDPRTLAEKKLVAELEEEMLDPRDRELKKLRAERQAEEAAKQRAKQEEHDRHVAVLKEKFAKDYTEQFQKALSETQVPATKHTVAEMAKYIARASEIGFKMTPHEAAQLVREDLLESQRRLLGDTDGEMLIKLLGEDVANKVRKWDTSRLKNPEPQRVSAQDQGQMRERRVPHKRMSAKEWREFNRR